MNLSKRVFNTRAEILDAVIIPLEDDQEEWIALNLQYFAQLAESYLPLRQNEETVVNKIVVGPKSFCDDAVKGAYTLLESTTLETANQRATFVLQAQIAFRKLLLVFGSLIDCPGTGELQSDLSHLLEFTAEYKLLSAGDADILGAFKRL